VIVGGDQGGIALAARLTRLEVATIVLEQNARAGDSWRKRYKSLCLHDPVWYDHLPYLPSPITGRCSPRTSWTTGWRCTSR
jgi:putative flavoprotein involved in K+ transport